MVVLCLRKRLSLRLCVRKYLKWVAKALCWDAVRPGLWNMIKLIIILCLLLCVSTYFALPTQKNKKYLKSIKNMHILQ